jgi:glucose-6-phosphate 1-dehydrogenase
MELSRSDAFVFFGATGDLARKQIWPALAALVKAGRLDMPVVAVGRKDIGTDAIRERARESLEASEAFDAPAFEKLSSRLSYVAVDYDVPETFKGIKEAVGSARHPLSYVALPPDVFEKVAANLAQAGLARDGRLVVEKPFGHDAPSARALSEALHAAFPEEAIFRIDHYLGKEQVENIVYFRASNPLFEASWNRDHVACIEITMAETFGVKGRAELYDGVGAIRDVVQNHLLEVVACIAMDLPSARGHAALREARTRLLARIEALEPEDVVRGQVHHRDLRGAPPPDRRAEVEGRPRLRPRRQVARGDGDGGHCAVEGRRPSRARGRLCARAQRAPLQARPGQPHRARGEREVTGRADRGRLE